ncbi:reverse transcriptase domain-containing protein [Artemisia annua]|uniref:Reverse transcriptase domain-containing protein n=1 Tax=Artemisia annua TaxID=35608 RepID=A0A2U1KEA4_ARTAN|nr:reverse transcriptase domain-containing protein [Artemisia annua]
MAGGGGFWTEVFGRSVGRSVQTTLCRILMTHESEKPGDAGSRRIRVVVGRDWWYLVLGSCKCRRGSVLAMRRASNVVDLMSLLPQLHDPWSELLLLRSCLGIVKVFFSLRTCQPVHMEVTALFFDKGLRDLIV